MFFDEVAWIAVLLKNNHLIIFFIFPSCVLQCVLDLLKKSLYAVDFVNSWVIATVIKNLIFVGQLTKYLSFQFP